MHAIQIPNADMYGQPIVFSADQTEHEQLPAVIVDKKVGMVMTLWTFTPEERKSIAEGADIGVNVITFGNPLQPIRLEVWEVA